MELKPAARGLKGCRADTTTTPPTGVGCHPHHIDRSSTYLECQKRVPTDLQQRLKHLFQHRRSLTTTYGVNTRLLWMIQRTNINQLTDTRGLTTRPDRRHQELPRTPGTPQTMQSLVTCLILPRRRGIRRIIRMVIEPHRTEAVMPRMLAKAAILQTKSHRMPAIMDHGTDRVTIDQAT